MADEKKYTAGEAVVMAIVAPFFAAGILAAAFPITVYCAWCDMHLWNWFGAPYLHLSPMSLWLSVGIGLWIRLQTTNSKVVKGEETRAWAGIAASVVGHTITLGIAYLIHLKGLA